jgi:hypothetical protein
MNNPVQVQRSTGAHFRLNYYVVPVGVVALPRAVLRLHGVIHVEVLRTWETQAKNIIFILILCERLHNFLVRINLGSQNDQEN